MSPCTPAACWVGPGRARWRPPPRRRQRRWSSWCRPGCRDCRCSEGDFYCGEKKEKTSLSAVCHRSDWPCFLWFAVASMTRRSISSSGRTDRAAFNPQLTRYGCHPRWTGRLRSARLTWRWRRFPTSPAREQDTGSTWGSGTRQGHSYESNLVTEFKCFLFTASTEDLFW